MSVGLLLITHNEIGAAILHAASRMLGNCPLEARALAVTEDSKPDELRIQARAMAAQVDSGDGVLVLTDLYGSTPSNIANSVPTGSGLRVLAGINLSMVVRVLNYPALSLADLAEKAFSGGRDGILLCPDRDDERRP